ncbi:4-hydroxy-tetrahydrodipicolinate reductase [Siculibacillus lacustris]|uniref:4-hydroxy-tetrahydrodipicolinate reductase n=1 Tax=Siculibacillus lacustris TaxID=1549641 RepID=A0A4Q9VTY4_9HYPH|nr:4-hydroxy-tetrahydrodipicolinate reductase [Siculibacillus lacustris]TBW38455.1 4-hydroxy-tetrahydrodipicolinate reductase [Siculibacillus lacustris]
MSLRIVVAGATGWVGRALITAIAAAPDLELAAAVSRARAGEDAGTVAGGAPLGVALVGSLEEALTVPSDVVIDYTAPDAVAAHVHAALAAGRHVVVGTSGLGSADYGAIDAAARAAGRGVVAAGNFSITATLLKRFALEAARWVDDVEVIDYASPRKPDTPSGTARELAEALSEVRRPATSLPPETLAGLPATRGATIAEPTPIQVHSLRLPSFVLSCEAIFGAPDERLVIRHDAGSSPTPYVAGTLLAARRVVERVGLTRGLDPLLVG